MNKNIVKRELVINLGLLAIINITRFNYYFPITAIYSWLIFTALVISWRILINKIWEK